MIHKQLILIPFWSSMGLNMCLKWSQTLVIIEREQFDSIKLQRGPLLTFSARKTLFDNLLATKLVPFKLTCNTFAPF